jgi:PKD repeat protein
MVGTAASSRPMRSAASLKLAVSIVVGLAFVIGASPLAAARTSIDVRASLLEWPAFFPIVSIGGSFSLQGSVDDASGIGTASIFDLTMNLSVLGLFYPVAVLATAENVRIEYDFLNDQLVVSGPITWATPFGPLYSSGSFVLNRYPYLWYANTSLIIPCPPPLGPPFPCPLILPGYWGGRVTRFDVETVPAVSLSERYAPREAATAPGEYVFRAVYRDSRGTLPEGGCVLVVDGMRKPLDYAGGNPASSSGAQYQTQVPLACGRQHFYYYVAYGDSPSQTRAPSSGLLSFRTGECGEPCTLEVSVDNAGIQTMEDQPWTGQVFATVVPEDATVSFGTARSPRHGSLSWTNSTTGRFYYNPDEDYAGQDSFRYEVRAEGCGTVLTNQAEVEITIIEVDDPPIAKDGTEYVNNAAAGVCIDLRSTKYVSDPDHSLSQLSFAIFDEPDHGDYVNLGDGGYHYTPDPGYKGNDRMDFRVWDPLGGEDSGSVYIVVVENQSPVARPKNAVVEHNGSVFITIVGDDPDGDSVTFSIVSDPEHGTLSDFNSTLGTLTYSADHGYTGSDGFVFAVSDGEDSDQAQVTIEIGANSRPRADIGGGYHIPPGGTTTLSGSSSEDPDGSIASYEWDLDDDSAFDDATGATTSFTRAVAGEYPVHLRVTDDEGATDEDTTVVIVDTLVGPAPAFEYAPSPVYEGDEVQFTDTSTDADGTITSWSWDFGAGGTSTLRNPSYTFTFEGTYNVELTVLDSDGLSSSCDTEIQVLHKPPVAKDASYGTPEDTPLGVVLQGVGTSLVYEITQHPPHGSLSGTPPDVTYTPSTNYNGDDEFRFHVDDGQMTSDPGTISISVASVPDSPLASDQGICTKKDTSAQIYLRASDPDSSALQFAITNGPSHGSITEFDSGTGRLVYVPSAGYRGDDSVEFSATDPDGLSDIGIVQILVGVSNPSPVAHIDPSATVVEAGNVVDFDGTVSYDPEGDSITSYQWDFGDGETEAGQQVSHVFPSAGHYPVSLVVTDEWGTVSSPAEQVITVLQRAVRGTPTADFDFLPRNPDVGEAIQFDASTSKGAQGSEISSYQWSFGDGSSATGRSVSHKYSESGWYSVKLRVEDALAKQDQLVRNVYVAKADDEQGDDNGPEDKDGEEPTLHPGAVTAERLEDGSVRLVWENRCPSSGWTEVWRAELSEAQWEEGQLPGADEYRTVRTVSLSLSTTDDPPGIGGWYVYRVVNYASSEEYEMSDPVLVQAEHYAPRVSFTCEPQTSYMFNTSPRSFQWETADGRYGELDLGSHLGEPVPPPDRYFVDLETGYIYTYIYFDPVVDVDGSVDEVTYEWDFGDGCSTKGSGAYVNHCTSNHYWAPGEYTVTLAVTDEWGQSSSASSVVVIRDYSRGQSSRLVEIRGHNEGLVPGECPPTEIYVWGAPPDNDRVSGVLGFCMPSGEVDTEGGLFFISLPISMYGSVVHAGSSWVMALIQSIIEEIVTDKAKDAIE